MWYVNLFFNQVDTIKKKKNNLFGKKTGLS